MKNLLLSVVLSLILTGCISNLDESRRYSGPAGDYQSSRSDIDVANCIKHGWQEVFADRPSDIWMTEKAKDGKYSIYTPGFIYLADVKASNSGSHVTYFHNGDRLWGTREKLIDKIKKCL